MLSLTLYDAILCLSTKIYYLKRIIDEIKISNIYEIKLKKYHSINIFFLIQLQTNMKFTIIIFWHFEGSIILIQTYKVIPLIS